MRVLIPVDLIQMDKIRKQISVNTVISDSDQLYVNAIETDGIESYFSRGAEEKLNRNRNEKSAVLEELASKQQSSLKK